MSKFVIVNCLLALMVIGIEGCSNSDEVSIPEKVELFNIEVPVKLESVENLPLWLRKILSEPNMIKCVFRGEKDGELYYYYHDGIYSVPVSNFYDGQGIRIDLEKPSTDAERFAKTISNWTCIYYLVV